MKSVLIVALLLWAISGVAKESKKQSRDLYRTMIRLSDSGLLANPQLARELPIRKFMAWYLENGREIDTKKYGRVSVDSIGNDGTFAYFTQRNGVGNFEFVKVKARDLAGIDVSKLDGQHIRRRFIAELVPQADKDRAGRYSNTGFESRTFTYAFNPESGTVRISYKWVVTLDFARAINRTYSATYDPAGNRFLDDATTVINHKK